MPARLAMQSHPSQTQQSGHSLAPAHSRYAAESEHRSLLLPSVRHNIHQLHPFQLLHTKAPYQYHQSVAAKLSANLQASSAFSRRAALWLEQLAYRLESRDRSAPAEYALPSPHFLAS